MKVIVWYSAGGNMRTKKISGTYLQPQVYEDSPPSAKDMRAGHVWELDENGDITVAHLFAAVAYMRHEFR